MSRIRFHLLIIISLTCALAFVTEQSPTHRLILLSDYAIYKRLSADLPRVGERAKSARLELDYWYGHRRGLEFPVRKLVNTPSGQVAEVVFLKTPSGMRGTDFSMAFLLVDRKVVDWTSCLTHGWNESQTLLLEDVDGDGFPDVAFRASHDSGGPPDKRQQTRPNDDRTWWSAYVITPQGFRSLFPDTARNLKVKLAYATAKQPVVLKVEGLPESLREQKLVEFTVSATNRSARDVPIDPEAWFRVKMSNTRSSMSYHVQDNRSILKPGDTITQVLHFYVEVPDAGAEPELAMRWEFVPRQNRRQTPFHAAVEHRK